MSGKGDESKPQRRMSVKERMAMFEAKSKGKSFKLQTEYSTVSKNRKVEQQARRASITAKKDMEKFRNRLNSVEDTMARKQKERSAEDRNAKVLYQLRVVNAVMYFL